VAYASPCAFFTTGQFQCVSSPSVVLGQKGLEAPACGGNAGKTQGTEAPEINHTFSALGLPPLRALIGSQRLVTTHMAGSTCRPSARRVLPVGAHCLRGAQHSPSKGSEMLSFECAPEPEENGCGAFNEKADVVGGQDDEGDSDELKGPGPSSPPGRPPPCAPPPSGAGPAAGAGEAGEG